MFKGQGWEIRGDTLSHSRKRTPQTHLREKLENRNTCNVTMTQVLTFDVFLTVNHSIILATDQLNAQILVLYIYYIPLHVSTLLCSSSGGQTVLHSIWYRHTLQAAFRCAGAHRTATYRV